MISYDWQLNDFYPNKANRNKLALNNVFNTVNDTESIQLNENNYSETVLDRQKNSNAEENIFLDAFSVYQKRSSFPTYTNLDFLLPEPFLLSGTLTTLHTPDKAGRAFLIRCFIILILKYYAEGIVFIDCTNVFPAYELIETTIESNPLIDPQLPIRAVQLSRSFNYHQATEVIKEQLEPLLREGFSYNLTDELTERQEKKFVKPKFIIIAGLPDLYLNKESAQYLEYDGRPEWWSIFELQETIGYLRSLVIKYDCVGILTSSSAPLSKTRPLGGKFLSHSSAVIIKIATEGSAHVYGELLKHPFANYKTVLLQILKKKGKKKASMPLKYFLGL